MQGFCILLYNKTMSQVTADQVRQVLATVIDPELNVDIVSLGLIYDVSVAEVQTADGSPQQIHILMTLTTPGCPLSAVFDTMIREALRGLGDIDVDQDVRLELTFDPPWVPEMMSAESRARLGFD